MKDWMESFNDPVFLAALMNIGLKLFGALLALMIGLRVAKWLAGAGERALVRAEVESTAAIFLRKVLYVLLVVVLLLGVLQVLGIPMTSMVAVVGAAGLAIGLALKDSLSNLERRDAGQPQAVQGRRLRRHRRHPG
jgi:small conductance mechanosensitive channel